jgi:NitT/TauT family transport system substrate-binding protein
MPNSLTRRRFLEHAGAAGLAGSLVPTMSVISYGQGRPTKVVLTLPYIPHGGFAWAICARDLGFWKSRDLDVEVVRGYGTADALKKVGLGQFPYGDGGFSVLIQTVAQGMDLVGLGLQLQISPLGVFSLKKNNIKTPKDLEGKTIGATATTGDYQLFPAFAKAANIDRSKIKFQLIDFSLRTQMLLDGRIDALTGYYSTEAPPIWAAGGEVDIMLYHQSGIKMYDNGIFATRGQIDKYPEVTKAIVEGAMEGLKFTYLQPAKALDTHVKAVKEYDNERGRQVIKNGIAIATALGVHPGPKQNGLGWFVPAEVAANVALAEQYLGVEKKLSPESLYTNKFNGTVKLTAQEWDSVQKEVQPYIIW